MSGRENRRYPRARLKTSVRVILGSIGSDVRYELTTKDVSINGFFLDFDNPARFPFNSSSIMEVWLELSGEKFIFFNGKMSRIVFQSEDETGEVQTGIAIRVIQIAQDQQVVLSEFINNYLDQAAPLKEVS